MTSSYWSQDGDKAACEHCATAFTLINRRHHCRDCGGIFCADCTPHRLPASYRGVDGKVRICVHCEKYNRLHETLQKVIRDASRRQQRERREHAINPEYAASLMANWEQEGRGLQETLTRGGHVHIGRRGRRGMSPSSSSSFSNSSFSSSAVSNASMLPTTTPYSAKGSRTLGQLSAGYGGEDDVAAAGSCFLPGLALVTTAEALVHLLDEPTAAAEGRLSAGSSAAASATWPPAVAQFHGTVARLLQGGDGAAAASSFSAPQHNATSSLVPPPLPPPSFGAIASFANYYR